MSHRMNPRMMSVPIMLNMTYRLCAKQEASASPSSPKQGGGALWNPPHITAAKMATTNRKSVIFLIMGLRDSLNNVRRN
jgi:hypothetical protein